MADETMGDRIRAAREARGMTSAALADAVGCRPATMYRYEKKGMKPGAETLAKISEALGVGMLFLTTGREPAEEEPNDDELDATGS